MEPIFLTPYFRPKIWGGRKLNTILIMIFLKEKLERLGLFPAIKMMLQQ